MDLKDILDIILIPISLAILAILWPEIQSRSRRRTFRRLIIRELSEISPYPKEATKKGWWQHCQKRFIHREIFRDPSTNRDFILSLDPDMVYDVAQLWNSLDEKNWVQWQYMLEQVNVKYVPGKDFADKRCAWEAVYTQYETKKSAKVSDAVENPAPTPT